MKLTLEQVRTWYDGKAGLKKVDPEIKSVINLLNVLPGCATICSCAGCGIIGGTKKSLHPKYQEPYIFMVCRNVHSMFLLMSAARSAQCIVEYIPANSKDCVFSEENQEDTICFRFYHLCQMARFGDKLIDLKKLKGVKKVSSSEL